MYLTAVDLSWEENVPAQIPTRRRTEGESLASSFYPSYGSQGPLPCLGMRKARAWGQIWPAFGKPDKPSPGPEPLSRVKWTERQLTGTGDKDAGSDQEFGGDSGHYCALETPSVRILPPAQGHCLEDSGAWAAFTSSHPLPRCPGGHRHVSAKRRDVGGGRATPVTAGPPREGPLPWPSPSFAPRVQPRRARCPQTIETTSSVPSRRPGCVCVSG